MTAPASKRGNTAWAQCPDCSGWLPVGPSLLAVPDIPLHCPHCQREFAQREAARLEDPAAHD